MVYPWMQTEDGITMLIKQKEQLRAELDKIRAAVCESDWMITDSSKIDLLSEIKSLISERDAAIQRGDTYRARARALRRQARIYRAAYNGNFELGLALMPKREKSHGVHGSIKR